jgi:hypothetical protein
MDNDNLFFNLAVTLTVGAITLVLWTLLHV